ncbi:hypothetical protein SPRG_20292, partial [Saprolegnia parasitica CBS 223.65]
SRDSQLRPRCASAHERQQSRANDNTIVAGLPSHRRPQRKMSACTSLALPLDLAPSRQAHFIAVQ